MKDILEPSGYHRVVYTPDEKQRTFALTDAQLRRMLDDVQFPSEIEKEIIAIHARSRRPRRWSRLVRRITTAFQVGA